MSLAYPRLGSALLLPFRRLPASHFPKAFRLPAIPLVVPPRLKPPAAPLPQTASPPQPPPAGPDTSACRKIPMSHGSVDSLGSARGGVASPGTPRSAHDSARCGRTAPVARSYGPLRRRAPSQEATAALCPFPEWPTEAKKTRKETAQICAALKETNLSKETGRRRTRPHKTTPVRPSCSPKSRPSTSPVRKVNCAAVYEPLTQRGRVFGGLPARVRHHCVGRVAGG